MNIVLPAAKIPVALRRSGGPDRIPTLTAAGPGAYRIRVPVRGRDAATHAAVSDPVEQYPIIAWPAPLRLIR